MGIPLSNNNKMFESSHTQQNNQTYSPQQAYQKQQIINQNTSQRNPLHSPAYPSQNVPVRTHSAHYVTGSTVSNTNNNNQIFTTTTTFNNTN